MSAEVNSPVFEPLPIRKRAFVGVDANQYHIWTVSGETRQIKADTAYEAFRLSGLTGISKIERVSNLDQTLIVKEKLAEVAGTVEEVSLHDQIRRRRNPIILADELDELMRSLQKESGEVQVEAVLPPPPAAQTPLAMEPPPVPKPEQLALSAGVPSPVGLDVHGDGFDEIIPAAPVKPVHAKPQEPKEAPKTAASAENIAPDATPLPDKELTPEEVEKLLGETPKK